MFFELACLAVKDCGSTSTNQQIIKLQSLQTRTLLFWKTAVKTVEKLQHCPEGSLSNEFTFNAFIFRLIKKSNQIPILCKWKS